MSKQVMAESDSATITCPGCGKPYRWREAFAGKVLDCKCGASFSADDPSQPLDADKLASRSPVRVGAYAQAFGRKSDVLRALERQEDAAQGSRVREFYVPAIALPVGWFVGVLLWQRVTATPMDTAIVVAVALMLQVTVFLPAMVATMVTVARWFDLGLGTLGSVLFKCLAMTLGPAAGVDALFTWMMAAADYDWWLLAAGYAYYLILFGAPTAMAFELNIYETALATAMIYVPRIAAVYIAALAFPNVFV